DGDITVAFADNGKNYARRRLSGTWGDPVEVASYGGGGSYPALAISPNGTVAIVIDPYGNGTQDLVMRRIAKGASTWDTLAVDSGGDPYRPSVAFDEQGDTVV